MEIQNPRSKRFAYLIFGVILSFVICLLPFTMTSASYALDNPEQKLAEVIEDYVITRYPDWIGLEIGITFKYAGKIFEDLKGFDEDADFVIVEVYKDFKPVGNVIFPIVVTSDEKSKKIFIRSKIEVFYKVVAAQKRIKRGELVVEEDVALEKRDIAMLPQKYFENLDQVIGTETRTTIPKGSTIFEWMIKKPPLVHRGDEISILVKGTNLLVKTKGIVVEDGYLGKKTKVRVESEDSKKIIEGILISADEIEVKLK